MAKSDEALLKEIRSRYDAARAAWDEVRDEGDIDLRFVSGDPWSPKDREAREKAGRPCLRVDELSQYFNQSINDVRANPLAVKFSPRGGGASEKGAEFYQSKMREIEYRSKAQMAYTTAFENCVQRSYGAVRLETRWVDDETDPWRQELWIVPVVNPNQITPDPYFQRPDGSDLRYLFDEEAVPWDEFARDYPDAEAKSFSADLKLTAPKWVREDSVTVANYWTVEVERKTLRTTKPDGAKVSRDLETRRVWCYRTNGVEILSKKQWAGKYIPYAFCLGKVLWRTDGGEAKRTILSMTRLARDPQMLYAYYRTCEAELVGLTPKFPYFAYRGSLDKAQKDLVAQSLHEPVAVIEVNPTVEGVPPGTILPMPQRQPYEPPIAALEMGAESARRAIQAAMGISPLPTDALRQNQKSGKALDRIESSQQKGSYHFKDHYQSLIEFVGIMAEDLIDKVHDTATATAVRHEDESSEMVPINDPNNPASIQTKGNYLVTVSAGPSFESMRAEAADFLDKIAGLPQVFPLVASEIVRLKQLGPEGDRIAEILEMLKPPQVQQMLQAKKEGGQQDPQMLMQQMLAMKEQLGQAEQVMSQMKQEADIEAAKQQATLEKAKLDAEVQLELQRMKDATSIRVAEIAAESKGTVSYMQHSAQHEQQAGALAHESEEAERTRQHEAQMADQQRQAALEQQQVGTDQKMALQEQAGQQKIQQQEMAGEQQLTLAEQQANQQAAQAAAQETEE